MAHLHLCFGESCFAPFVDSVATTPDFGTEPLNPGDTLITSLHVFTYLNGGTANVQLQVGTFHNPNNRTTIDFTAIVLPVSVELTSFAASVHEGEVVLNWSTATETNNHGFEIQRNLNGEFFSVGFVDGYGTTTEIQYYTFTDKNLEVGSYTYRLKQVDFDGTFEYSESVEINVLAPNVFTLQQNFPNPFNPETIISYSIPNSGVVTLKVYDMLGREIQTLVNEFQSSKTYSVNFDASDLSSGIYLYKLQAGDFLEAKKMILIK